MSKSFVWGFIVGVALLIVAGVGASRLQDKNAVVKERNEKQYRTEIVDATPVQPGALTEKQRFHSRLHNGVGMRVDGKTISEWIASYKGQRVFLGTDVLGRRFLASDQLETPEDFFGRLAQESDAVIRGRITGKISQITEDDSFLFTDYDVVVSEVFQNNLTAPIDRGTTITFTSLGGKIVLDDVIMKAGGNGQVLYPISNQDILLFLKFIPETGSYKLTRDTGSFELNGASVRPFAGLFPLPPGVFKNEASFLKVISAVSNK
jgi:hypothetical protein